MTIYSRLRALPTPRDLELLDMVCSMAALVFEHQRLHQQLLLYAYHDVLTGLPNRRLGEERLEIAIAQAKSRGQPGRGALDRSRRLQACQRYPRTSARRPGAAGDGGASPEASALHRHRGAHGRRRVHGHPQRRAEPCLRRADRCGAAPDRDPAAGVRSGRSEHRDQHRHLHVPRGWRDRRAAEAERGHGDVSGEERACGNALVLAGDRAGSGGAARAERGAVARAAERRIRDRLPAAVPAGWLHRWLGGAAALPASAPGGGPAVEVHPHRRGDGADYSAGLLGARTRLPPEHGVAEHGAWRPLPIAVNISALQFARKDFAESVGAILKRPGWIRSCWSWN